MDWKRLLAYITGSVDQELLLRNEYLVTENRILRKQIRGRVRLTDSERISLALIGKRQTIEDLVVRMAKEDRIGERSGELSTRERLGGLLKFYHREAA